MEAERVQKLLAQAGIASRRKCEELIKEGRVSVNGVVIGIGASATQADDIRVDGKRITFEKHIYIMLYKPAGVTSTVSDPHAHTTVLDLVKVPQRVFPVGRLDKETEGLLILTNDGDLMQRLTHPSHGTLKTYIISTDRPITSDELERLRRGIVIEGRRVETRDLRILAPGATHLRIHEGRKHIVRLLFQSLGHRVKRLVRVSVGDLKLGNLEPGQWRTLSAAEVAALRKG